MNTNKKNEAQLLAELDELRKRNAELEKLQIDHIKTKEALSESEEKYRTIVERANDGIVVIQDGILKFVNVRLAELFGGCVEEMTGTQLLDYFPPEERNKIMENYHRRITGSDFPSTYEVKALKKNGAITDIEINSGKITYMGKPAVFVFVRDIAQRKQVEKNLLSSKLATILGLAKLAEFRDTDTGEHLERIQEYTKALALKLANKQKYANYITTEYIEDIYRSSVLHDIGKVGIPDSILLKPEKLTPEEFELIKPHSKIGGDTLKIIDSKFEYQSFLTMAKEIAYSHHEKWNGKGYPKGLAGEKIPLSARIVALADVYDALTTVRCYKDSLPHEKAREIIVKESGMHFDPEIVTVFQTIESEFERISIEMQN